MKKSTFLVVVLLLAFTPLLNAQVGIGTTNPKALLHIVANPGTSPEESGIILPKVSALPSANLDGKKGMFLYLDSNNSAEGIYFFNGEKWKKNDNAWRLGGNTLTANEFIGTKNQKDLNFKVDNKQRLKIGAAGDLEYQNANNNKLIGISNNGNYTINNANNNKLIEIKNNGVITLPYTDLVDINSNKKSIATKEYVDTNLASSSGGVLEEITEGANTGYRINGSTNAANFGDIGNEAVDLSYSSGTSTFRGATGDYSFAAGIDNLAWGDYSFVTGQGSNAEGPNSIAMGRDNRAMARYSTAIGGFGNDTWGWYSFATGKETIANSYAECSLGHFNTNLNAESVSGINTKDRVLSVGIGTNHWGRADAIEIFKDGKIYADELDIAEITDAKQLVTKEYVDTKGGVLEEITEGSNTGYRINGSTNGANYGDIGNYATDLSYSFGASTTYGATGDYSFATGFFTTASGDQSFAAGNGAKASGARAFAMGNGAKALENQSFATGNLTTASGGQSFATGNGTTASGEQTFAIGTSTNANSYSEVALGHFNTNLPATSTNGVNTSDRILSVGIGTGTGTAARADALEIFKDGRIFADELEVSEITKPKQLVTKEYVDANGGGGVLEKITEGTFTYPNGTIIDKTGYRINGSGNADNYGDIGIQAVDLSYNGGSSTTRGATNWYAFAAGYTAEASGSISAVLGGANNIASGYNSTTVGGYKNTASGSYSLSGGYGTKAQTYGEVALGLFNDPLPTYTGYIGDAGFKAQDRILSVGIGTSDSDRKNAIEVFKDGTIYADELEVGEITEDQQLVTKKYVDDKVSAASGGGVTVKSSSSISINNDNKREIIILNSAPPSTNTLPTAVDGKVITIYRNTQNDIQFKSGGNIVLPFNTSVLKLTNNVNNTKTDFGGSVTFVYSASENKWYIIGTY